MSHFHDSLDYVLMECVCPECREKMIVRVGLLTQGSDNLVECPCCHQDVVALVPGPVIGGPFLKTA